MHNKSRNEYPRPDFKRDSWLNLNGIWDFTFQSRDIPDTCYIQGSHYNKKILVPFCYQSKMSGIGTTKYYETVWYSRQFHITPKQKNKKILLHFAGVDYYCRLYINGKFVGEHEGGYDLFTFEISEYVFDGDNRIVLKVTDDRRVDHPRGKQYWEDIPDRCWYTESTGIWKPVWLEFTEEYYLETLRILPDINLCQIHLDTDISKKFKGYLRVKIFWKNELCQELSYRIISHTHVSEIITIPPQDFIDEIHYWSPEHPNLYSITLELMEDNYIYDKVESYFGMRQIEIKNEQIYLNHRPLYQRLILDQGYWPDTLLTAPDEKSIIRDLELIKEMGFNGLRMHQKIEEPLFYYHADRLGLFVWLELPSPYDFGTTEIHTVLNQWEAILKNNWNHPSIITYVPFNESWGLRNIAKDFMQQSFANCVYYLTKALDPTRIISTNDGWEFPCATDFYGFHDYFSSAKAFDAQYADWEKRFEIGMTNRPLKSDGTERKTLPVLLTEFGGIAFKNDLFSAGSWGYNESVATDNAFEETLTTQISSILKSSLLCGYCYTQLTDVMQEVNGLLHPDRTPKIAFEKYRKIFGRNPIYYQ